jgi:hypothetical protein
MYKRAMHVRRKVKPLHDFRFDKGWSPFPAPRPPAEGVARRKGGLSLMTQGRCPVCGSEEVVVTEPLTILDSRATVTVSEALQCTLCGHLECMIPQAALVRWYPPDLRYLNVASRQRLKRQRRRRAAGHRGGPTPRQVFPG